MKKQKFMKLTAFASAPSMENSFSSPETHSAEISVVFSGKSVKIHGWDGSAWSVIYTWNSVDKQYTFNNTFESYFLESLTGGDETMGVSFFSVDRYQGSTPTLAGVNREVKLYDVDEVPIYTASDAGKMLTIMSDGSLRWLGASVTWMIDGSPVPEPEPSTSYVEDRADLTLEGTAALNNSVLSFDGAGYATIPDGFRYTDNLTVSVWFKTTATGDRRIISSHIRSAGYNGFFVMLSNGQLWYRHPDQAGVWTYGPSGLNDGEWHHFAMTYEAGGQWAGYLDGVQIDTGAAGAATGYLSNWPCYIGANGWNGNNPYGLFIGEINNIQIENQTMTEAEVLSIYSGGFQSEVTVLDENGQTFVRANRDVLNLGDDPSYDRVEGEDFAVEGEFKLASLWGSGIFDVLGKGQNAGWMGWAVILYSGYIRMFAHSAGSATSAHGMNASFSPVVGQWYHFKAIWKADGKQEMWVDGVKLAERTVTGAGYFPPIDSTYDMKIGEVFTNEVRNFDGDIRNVKIQSGVIN